MRALAVQEVNRAEKGFGSGEFHARLPCEAASVPQARARTVAWCAHCGTRPDIIADVQLSVTEAAANAVRHSGCSTFEIAGWVHRRSLIISVSDTGGGLDSPNPGLGLGWGIIHSVATSVDVDHTDPGTRLTMRFDQHPQDDPA